MDVGEMEGPGRASPVPWTEEMKDSFIDALAETCNVRKAAAAAGVRTYRAYALKLREAAFAERWAEAMAIGYGQVEERLIRDAMGETGEDGPPMSKYDREQALNLLKFHHGEAGAKPHRGGTPLRRATEAETDEAILKKLAALKRRLER